MHLRIFTALRNTEYVVGTLRGPSRSRGAGLTLGAYLIARVSSFAVKSFPGRLLVGLRCSSPSSKLDSPLYSIFRLQSIKQNLKNH